MYDGNARMADPSHPVFQLLMTTIEKAQRLSQRQGSHFLVLLMPTKEEIYLPLLDKPARRSSRTSGRHETQHIPYIDLTPYFQARARELGPLFFEVDGHPNPSGYQLIADVVLEYLNEHGAVYGLGNWQPHPQATTTFRRAVRTAPRIRSEARLCLPGSRRHHLADNSSIDARHRRAFDRSAATSCRLGRCSGMRGGTPPTQSCQDKAMALSRGRARSEHAGVIDGPIRIDAAPSSADREVARPSTDLLIAARRRATRSREDAR